MMFDPINFINKEFNRLHTKSSIEVEIQRRDSSQASTYHQPEVSIRPQSSKLMQHKLLFRAQQTNNKVLGRVASQMGMISDLNSDIPSLLPQNIIKSQGSV
jgi:hypothetical protein